jgi:hypothetical protein
MPSRHLDRTLIVFTVELGHVEAQCTQVVIEGLDYKGIGIKAPSLSDAERLVIQRIKKSQLQRLEEGAGSEVGTLHAKETPYLSIPQVLMLQQAGSSCRIFFGNFATKIRHGRGLYDFLILIEIRFLRKAACDMVQPQIQERRIIHTRTFHLGL